MIQTAEISRIKSNPNNPRIIKDEKFEKLVESIKNFPEMLNIRPIVVNADFITLGGNMRLKACKEAGLKEVPIIIVNDLSEEKQREFIIKDNIGFGEWDWEMLQAQWDTEELSTWGLETGTIAWEESIENMEADMPEYKTEKKITIIVPEEKIELINDLVYDLGQVIKDKYEGCTIK